MELSAKNNVWVERFARAGLGAKGVVYILVGLLAFMAAFEIGGQRNDDADRDGALVFLRDSPGGLILLGLLILGLISYSAWRIVESFSLPSDKTKNWAKKLRYWASALTYLTVAFAAYQVLQFQDDGGGEHWSKKFFNKDYGKVIIAIIALGMAGNGIYQIWYGWSSKFKDHFHGGTIHSSNASHLLKSGKIGYISRGIVWLIISYMLLKAVWVARASEAGDTAEAFSFVETYPYGSYLLGALGIGLVAYGVFNLLRAGYEEFD